MSETAAGAPAPAGGAGGSLAQFASFAIPNRANLNALSKRTDLFFATAVMGILTVLIFPLPAFLLDLLLAVSIIISVLIMMTGLFIDNPLEFTVFPTLLLVATLLRLALNLASTRLILGHGHEGTAAAGHVIEAFGNFVMGGNFVIGIIVFAILIIVNFVVITKGSGRIAEVAARFTLDAMPGKQMAIDADLSAGLIDEKVAKARRAALEEESSFFGAMDGASKFVRGDAIAALLITFINVIGGIIIGVAQQGMPFLGAAKSYTLLTIGDGLASQVPALIVSTAAGILVSKAGVKGSADKALGKQLANYPKALGMSSGVMVLIALLPGMPMLPFLALAGASGYAAWHFAKVAREAPPLDADGAPMDASAVAAAAAAKEETVTDLLKLDDLKLEMGYALLALVNGPEGQDRLTDQIKALRRQLAAELGFVMPSVRILDNVQLDANAYVVRVKEIEAGTGQIFPGQFMAMDPMGGQVQLPGQHMLEPTFGLPATWIDASLRDQAQLKGYTVVDAATVVSTHLTEIIKAHVSELLNHVEVQKLLREVSKEHAELLKEVMPSQIGTTGIQRVLQFLLAERVSIRDLGAIIEGVAEVAGHVKNPRDIVEHVRARLGRQICAQYQGPDGMLPIITLSPAWEQAFLDSIAGERDERYLAMQPSKLSDFVNTVRDRFETAARMGEMPVLVTSVQARPFVRSIIERFRRETPVMSQAEIHPRARLRTVGSV
ncbi:MULTISPECIES: flagellar biosynthesis protein FlhA [unclassified Methylobacterium]|uniref:flagellar biosynthesis protein FlhA n=1 Tax=unclassified Methylobacterium TaxID=2615210 RepID=UPI0006FE6E0B|nr:MULTISPECIES: flagellar biosynthesis protein FlhA [unclassified Methylobacterium]KQO70836.1 flagellar biosynthesis protein FlhA [Methylobacterium sp. Leaf88]KQP72621.1 flagellar biosynthesis protein FlhA [Methylobacterium sp. Leaf111]KQT79926.1 flagellar biosynthesis protein FlhA [Methylobacterium sp. Leaf465]KQU16056.1 flagellar biosynthesis protein FlhA [Methylobacterium sp. Leaf94]